MESRARTQGIGLAQQVLLLAEPSHHPLNEFIRHSSLNRFTLCSTALLMILAEFSVILGLFEWEIPWKKFILTALSL